MASAWGDSFGSAWGDSWGSIAPAPIPVPTTTQSGGGSMPHHGWTRWHPAWPQSVEERWSDTLAVRLEASGEESLSLQPAYADSAVGVVSFQAIGVELWRVREAGSMEGRLECKDRFRIHSPAIQRQVARMLLGDEGWAVR